MERGSTSSGQVRWSVVVVRGLALCLLLASDCVPLGAQSLAAGVIDVYGAQHVGAPALRAALGLTIGDTLGMDTAATLVKRAEQRLARIRCRAHGGGAAGRHR